jgi:hypothetical protein
MNIFVETVNGIPRTLPLDEMRHSKRRFSAFERVASKIADDRFEH